MRLIAFLVMVLFTASHANASQPCSTPTKEWFIQNVISGSDLIVLGEITDYSKTTSSQRHYWTDIKVLQVFHGPANKDAILRILRIKNWQSMQPPLYYSDKKTQAIFFLKHDGKQVLLTDHSWKKCGPSIWGARKKGLLNNAQFYSPYHKGLMDLGQLKTELSDLMTQSSQLPKENKAPSK